MMLLERDGVCILQRSSVIETDPAGCPLMEDGSEQPKFLNAVVKGETGLSPQELLRTALAIERELGRVRSFKNAPRPMDIDILLYGDMTIDTPELTVPHPRMFDREFVVKPLREIGGPYKRFDQAAATWDNEPRRLKLAYDIAEAIRMSVKIEANMDVMDFGCGTGLITLHLRPLARTITGVDTSARMLDVLQDKARKAGWTNVRTLHSDSDKTDLLNERYHLIVTGMTFHHVRDIQELLGFLYDRLLPGGALCVADLDPEEGRFHPDATDVFHNGFDRDALGKMFEDAGFTGITAATVAQVEKPAADGSVACFSIFLITGRKKQS